MESVLLTTRDGHRLAADLSVPGGADGPIGVGGVVVCHPHPQHGGDRFNPVVDAVFRSAATSGAVALRFDFRAEFAGGVGERLDVIAALDELERRAGDGPLFVVGYSFGAVVALTTDDERIRGVVAIAPPLSMAPIAPPAVPVLLLVPQHDQFTSPDTARHAVEHWPSVEVRTVDSVDHFLQGRAAAVAETAADWLTTQR